MYATVPSENDLISSKQTTDDEFLILYGLLLLLLQVGLACVESSRVCEKYTPDIFFKIFLHIMVSCSMYWCVGYYLSYGDGNFFTGYTASWDPPMSIPAAAAVYSNQSQRQSESETRPPPQRLYDALVIATPVTILSAAVLDRCNVFVFLIYTVIISGVVHPISVHWAWTTQGWLHSLGYDDFSGTGVVFAFAGASCFIASLVIGPRKGRFNENSEISPIYSTSLFGAGAMLTVIGLITFNCGALYRDYRSYHYHQDGGFEMDAKALNKTIRNTVTAGLGGCLIAAVIGRMRIQQTLWLFSNTTNGCVAAMVAVSAAATTYNAFEAFIVGATSALIFQALHYFMLLSKIDDPVDACPIYFGGGVWGIIAMKIFSSNGVLQSENLSNDAWFLLVNFAGVMAICLWSVTWTFVATLFVKGVMKIVKKDEAQAQDTSNLYEEDSCYIEALPCPYPPANANANAAVNIVNNENDNDKMKTNRDEYISRLKNNDAWKILNRESRLYENLGRDMELQIRR